MLTRTALESLKRIGGRDRVMHDPVELVTYESDASFERGTPDAVIFPERTEEVVALVQCMNAHAIPLVPRGAGTGLSGGAVADRGGVIVAFSRLNRVLHLDALGRRVVVQPGVLNLQLDELASQNGLYYPPDPSSQRASTLGGNVAENAGGPHCFKYGVTTNYVTGLKMVLADGRVVQVGGQALDYPEYDLGGLVIGSEGTLALVTEITVRLIRRPPGIKTMMAVFDTIEQCGAAVSQVIACGLVPATMELMDRNFVRAVEAYANAGLPVDAGALLIVEVDGYPVSLESQILEIASLLGSHGGRQLRIARDAEERDQIWLARKSAAGAFSRLAPRWYLVDITVPRSRLAETLHEANAICERHRLGVQYVLHAGDGNLHPVLLMPNPEDSDLIRRVHAAAHEIVELGVREKGSLTGEHGVGIEKREHMPLMFNPAELSAMWEVKQVFDPEQRFNPGKMLPAQYIASAPPPRASPSNGVLPSDAVILTPASTEQAAQIVTALANTGQRVRIGKQLRTTALNKIIEYAPDDLYVNVGAGMRLADLQAFLARDRLQVPLASPWPDATVGGIVAANTNAPLRMLYGGVRDLVLGMIVVLGDGRVLRAGRPVVKNVAGYDLPKVFVGSYGSLGLITDVTLKLAPVPRAQITLSWRVDDLPHAFTYSAQLLPMALVASGIALSRTNQSLLLTYTAEGTPENVDFELAQVRQHMQSAGAPSYERSWSTGMEPWTRLLTEEGPNSVVVRVGVAPQSVRTFALDNAAAWDDFFIDLPNGLIYVVKRFNECALARTWLVTMRQSAAALGGYVVALRSPNEWRLDPWGYLPDTLDLMRALKMRWDPWSVFESDFANSTAQGIQNLE